MEDFHRILFSVARTLQNMLMGKFSALLTSNSKKEFCSSIQIRIIPPLTYLANGHSIVTVKLWVMSLTNRSTHSCGQLDHGSMYLKHEFNVHLTQRKKLRVSEEKTPDLSPCSKLPCESSEISGQFAPSMKR